jgi:hypothetical protein
VNGTAPPERISVAAGATAAVTVSGGPANPADWVGLYVLGATDGAYADWRYLNGSTVAPVSGLSTATVAFAMPVVPGDYEFRLFANNGYERLATSAVVTATPTTAQLTVNGTLPPTVVPVEPGTAVTAGLSGGPANAGDWVGLFLVGAGDGAYGQWQYLNGTAAQPAAGLANATLTFAMPTTAGSYELRFFANNTFARLATSTTLVINASSARVAVNGTAPPTPVTVAAGSVAVITVSSGPANTGDWVGWFALGAPDTAYLDWRYLNGTTVPPAVGVSAGTVNFTTPVTAGQYEVRFFANSGFGRLATSSVITVPAPPAQIAVNGTLPPTPVAVQPGTSLAVQVTGAPGNPTDWVALARSGTPDTSYVSWRYLNGAMTAPSQGVTNAALTVALPTTSGGYEMRLFANNGFGRLATSSVVSATVQSGPPACSYALSKAAVTTSSAGRSDGFTVTTQVGCSWTVDAPSWIAVSPSSGQGSQTISYNLTPNSTDTSRVASISLADQTLTVTQAAAGCSPTVSPASIAADASGSSGTLQVSALWGCTVGHIDEPAIEGGGGVTVREGRGHTENERAAQGAGGTVAAALLLKDKKPENSHQWAMVKPSLRNGLNLVYEAAGGIDLKSAYRSPDRNREIKGAKPSDAHIWGVGADMKPAGYPTGNMKEADWNRLEDLVLSRAVGAVWTETPYSSSPDHVHASFEWWPGRPEYAQKHP